MSRLKDRIEMLKAKMQWSDQAMANVAGVSRSAVAQWRGQGSKIIHSIGDMRAAENLERETGYAALWIAKGEGQMYAKPAPSTAEWPFCLIDEEKLRKLDPIQMAQLEAAILIAAAQVGLDVKKS